MPARVPAWGEPGKFSYGKEGKEGRRPGKAAPERRAPVAGSQKPARDSSGKRSVLEVAKRVKAKREGVRPAAKSKPAPASKPAPPAPTSAAAKPVRPHPTLPGTLSISALHDLV